MSCKADRNANRLREGVAVAYLVAKRDDPGGPNSA